jgi:hypothetical protein
MAAPVKVHTQAWTKEEIAKLKELSRKGMTRTEIARVMKRTLDSVDHKAKRMKIRSVRYRLR